jgi:hypothetical protein
MPTQKVSITLEAESIAQARRFAGPRGLSSYVDAALAEKLEQDAKRLAFLAHVAELDAGDPPTPEERRRGEEDADRIRQAIGE